MPVPSALAGRHAAGQAYQSLQFQIRRGVYPQNSRLPAERDLAERLGVSRTTLRHALSQLESDGQVERRDPRGWFVTGMLGEPPSTLQSFTAMARSRGLEPTSRVLRQELRRATAAEASRLEAPAGTAVVDVVRLRGMSGLPICVDVEVVLATRAPAVATVELEDVSLYDVLRESGVRIVRSTCWLEAALPSGETAGLLGMDGAAPVLVSHSVSLDDEGSPVMLGTTTFRGDAYRFHADLYAPVTDVDEL
ncbi:GntR family transcriptional regulator [Oerskovia turbata]